MIATGEPLAPSLLDVNVLFALAWPSHIHHDRAHRWFAEVGTLAWATCPPTQVGFVRLSSNAALLPIITTPQQAIAALHEITALPGHVFWVDDLPSVVEAPVEPERIMGYRQVGDAHLLSLAIRRGGRLATFDRGLPELAGENRASVFLIP